jgi:UDP-N-acetylbacillosamine N-acetyltransferase
MESVQVVASQWRSFVDQNRDIFIYGMSGHGKVVKEIAQLNGYNVVSYIDDDASKNVYTFETFTSHFKNVNIAFGIGENHIRERLFNKLHALDYHFPVLIHPTAIISTSVRIAEATIVMPHVIVNSGSVIHRGVILNSGSIIEHDNCIADFVHISPGVSLAGEVTIGIKSHIGIGSTIIQQKNIGENSIIGAGSVVINNMPDNITAVGNPAIIIKRRP